ncbi:alpha/beta hydrolase [Herbiconiux sp. CPCC 205716]|uniref:Alpha/beta hydrolase n=1 Tax=Herbiconiux gentiana TaxID=2970912 RepID=A0ABT2GIV1_9MICO|nr:alpha/beta hydrolase [Herbiconiux gentiana]MCS5716093.1 alpha/beta hydrolase [Herbiconiux gentiana]
MVIDDATPLRFWPGLVYAERPEGALRLDVLAPAEGAGGAAGEGGGWATRAPGASGRGLAPVVVFLHGGGWHEGDRGAALHPWLNPLLAGRGFVTVAPTYRLSGTAVWPAALDDALDAVAWTIAHAEEFGGDPERVAVWGFSAGAQLAAMVALDPASGVRAAAVAACPADLRGTDPDADDEVTRLLGAPVTPERLAALSPVAQVRGAVVPFSIVHGTADEIVPVEQGEALRDAIRAAGGVAEWHAIEGGRHSWPDTPSAGLDEQAPSFGSLAADFFERML